MENLYLVYRETSYSQSPTHSRPAERGTKQAIQARPDHSDKVVSPPRGFSNDLQQVVPASNRSVCHKVQQQVTSVCVTSTESPGLSSGSTHSAMEGSGRIGLPTSSHLGQSSGEVARLPMQENHSDCSRVAQHALVLGYSGHVQPHPTESAQPAQPVNTALNQIPHRNLTNLNLHAWLLEPQQSKSRASLR